MATETASSDKGLGVTIAFGAIAAVAAGFMLFGATQSIKAWAFAAAMVAAAVSVAAIQLFEG
jgi:hypothetical protein